MAERANHYVVREGVSELHPSWREAELLIMLKTSIVAKKQSDKRSLINIVTVLLKSFTGLNHKSIKMYSIITILHKDKQEKSCPLRMDRQAKNVEFASTLKVNWIANEI